ncbi:MAG: DNA integrity scanning protein DisA nucleotide-binding domain protein [Nanoarchaeota archaeon]
MVSQKIQEVLGFTASQLYRELNADNILIVEAQVQKNFEENNVPETLRINVLRKGQEKGENFVLPNPENLQFSDKIKEILIEAIKLKLILQEAKVVFIFDRSCMFDFHLGMLVVEVSRVLYRIGKFDLGEHMEDDTVITKVIDLAEQIRDEGREGKKVGTLFVIGDEEELKPYLKSLILNPFFGYPENLRNVLQSDLSETIKNYAQLDGAFILSNDGTVLSCGTYLNVDTTGVKSFDGWGTRHLAAVAITAKTKAVAVLVSESGGLVKVFKNGKLILKI